MPSRRKYFFGVLLKLEYCMLDALHQRYLCQPNLRQNNSLSCFYHLSTFKLVCKISEYISKYGYFYINLHECRQSDSVTGST